MSTTKAPAAASVMVRMGEMRVVKARAGEALTLKTTLGSCVGILLTDKASGVYGLAHVMLPEKVPNDEAVGKFADSAVPSLLRQMAEAAGGAGGRIEALLIGGACMFECADGPISDIGSRNVEAARKALEAIKVPIVHDETGGNRGRTVVYDCERGHIAVKTLQKLETSEKGKEGGQA